MGLYTNTNQFQSFVKTDVCTSWLFNTNPHTQSFTHNTLQNFFSVFLGFEKSTLRFTDALSQPFLEILLKVSISIQKAWPIFFGRYPFCEQKNIWHVSLSRAPAITSSSTEEHSQQGLGELWKIISYLSRLFLEWIRVSFWLRIFPCEETQPPCLDISEKTKALFSIVS